jgi:hypothetical protein
VGRWHSILWVFVLAIAMAPLAAQPVRDQASSQGTFAPAPSKAVDRAPGSGGTQETSTQRGNTLVQAVELTSHFAVIAASLVAIYGIGAWRREFKGKRDIELAENALELFYRAERAIEAIRCPGSYSSEEQGRVPVPHETPEQEKARNQAHVVFRRIQDHGAIFDQLYALRFRFMARFGRERAMPFDEMKMVIDEIWVSAGCLAELWAQRLRGGDHTSQGTEQQIEKHQAVIWPMGEKDQIGLRVAEITEEIEVVCRPIIEGRRSWLSRLFNASAKSKEVMRRPGQVSQGN